MTFSKYILNENPVSPQKQLALETEAYLRTELGKVFSDESKYTLMFRGGSLGDGSLFIDLYHTGVKVTRHNSPIWTALSIFFETNSRRVVEGQFSFEASSYPKREGINFRKITGKTHLEAARKLVEWFKKNKPVYDHILSTIKE